VTTGRERARRLAELAAIIDSHHDWWRFPSEGPVRGFLGASQLFIVGDQPSTSPWESWHPNRRAFYDLLARLGVADAHLTDLYKKRGKAGTLRAGAPLDFAAHLKIFREELDILRPIRVVALGRLAHSLLAEYVPEIRSKLSWMWHFAHAVKYGKTSAWEGNARGAIGDSCGVSSSGPTAIPEANRAGLRRHVTQVPLESAGRHGQKGFEVDANEATGLVEKLKETPAGLTPREWTIRDDNNHHYHNQVSLAESPLVIKLRWRATARDPVHDVGLFRLNLPRLLARGLIREERSTRARGDVRVRFVSESGRIYLQMRDGESRMQIGQVGA